MIFIKELIFL